MLPHLTAPSSAFIVVVQVDSVLRGSLLQASMPAASDIRQAVQSLVKPGGDDTVLEYVIDILEVCTACLRASHPMAKVTIVILAPAALQDPDFDYGRDGEEAFEAFGAVLVRTPGRTVCIAVWRRLVVTVGSAYRKCWRGKSGPFASHT